MDRSGQNANPLVALPTQRRSESTETQHRIVAARACAVVLDREGEHQRAARLRAEADDLERDALVLVPVRVRRGV
jgi:hypothetical protein